MPKQVEIDASGKSEANKRIVNEQILSENLYASLNDKESEK